MPEEDVLHLGAHLAEQVQRAERVRVAGQRDVDPLGARAAAPSSSASSAAARARRAPPRRARRAALAAAPTGPRSSGGRPPIDGEHGRERAAAAGVGAPAPRRAPPAWTRRRRPRAPPHGRRDRLASSAHEYRRCRTLAQRPRPAARRRPRATLSDSAPRRLRDRDAARPAGRRRGPPSTGPRPARSAPRAITVGPVRSTAQGGTPPAATAATTVKPLAGGQVGRGDALEQRQREGGPHRGPDRPRVVGVGRARARARPSRRRARPRCGRGCRRCPGRRRRPGTAPAAGGKATVRKWCGPGWGSTASTRGGAASPLACASSARRHGVALGQAGRGREEGLDAVQALLVEQQGDRPDAARQGGLDQVLALGHQQPPLAAHLLGAQRAGELERRIARRGDPAQRRPGRATRRRRRSRRRPWPHAHGRRGRRRPRAH